MDNYTIERLKEIIEKLRAPDGCPWDKKQTPKTLLMPFLEEVYELIEAIEENESEKIKEELGDVLLHIIFQVVFAEEKGDFTLNDVLKEIIEKIIRRHPHVFGNLKTNNIELINANWEKIKQQEKGKENRKYLESIPKNLPALFKAYKMTKKVAKVGFDWPDIANIFEKIEEELEEFDEALSKNNKKEIEEELGDVLFMFVNLARFLDINPEEALQKTNKKFEKRFNFIEEELKKRNLSFQDVNLEFMDNLWEQAKKLEKS